jgi:ankyrin repeat protein
MNGNNDNGKNNKIIIINLFIYAFIKMEKIDEEKIDDLTRKKLITELDLDFYDPNLMDDDGETPLMLVNYEDEDDPYNFTKILIKDGADPNITNPIDRSSPLHYAVANNNSETVEHLLENGANPFFRDLVGYTPYELAIWYNYSPSAKLLKNYMIRKIQNRQLRRMTRRRAKTMRRLATAKSMLADDNQTFGNPMSHMDYDTMSHLMSNYLHL